MSQRGDANYVHMAINPVPPVNIPIPIKTGSKMGVDFTYPKMGSQNGFDNWASVLARGLAQLSRSPPEWHAQQRDVHLPARGFPDAPALRQHGRVWPGWRGVGLSGIGFLCFFWVKFLLICGRPRLVSGLDGFRWGALEAERLTRRSAKGRLGSLQLAVWFHPLNRGNLFRAKDTFCPFETWLFKQGNHHLQGNVQVYNVRIPVIGQLRHGEFLVWPRMSSVSIRREPIRDDKASPTMQKVWEKYRRKEETWGSREFAR